MTVMSIDRYEQERFLELIRDGVGAISAGVELGWSPAKTRELMSDPDFSELVEDVMTQMTETIEKVVFDRAQLGNRWAVEMWLYNRAPERWAPPTQKVQIRQHSISEVVVASVRGSVAELLAAHGPAALQPGGVLDVESRED